MSENYVYKGVQFSIFNNEALLEGVPVVGTLSKSRQECLIRMTDMIDEMQSLDHRPIQAGDWFIDHTDNSKHIVTDVLCIHKDDEGFETVSADEEASLEYTLQRPFSNAFVQKMILFPLGIEKLTRTIKVDWVGVTDVIYKSRDDVYNLFEVKRMVKVWQAIKDGK